VPNSSLSLLAAIALSVAVGTADAMPKGQGTQRQVQAPAIPAALRNMVRVDGTALMIRMNDGSRHRFDISELHVDRFETFARGRFVGFGISAHEEFGYVLIDRTQRGELAEIPTGDRPVFSEDGSHFAAAEVSASGYGNLDGIGLWQVRPRGVRRLFYTNAVREGHHWKTEAFRGPACVLISAVPNGWEPSVPDRYEQELATAERTYLELRWSQEEGYALFQSTGNGCFDDSSG
jgi:hypothetical protein